MVRRARGIGLLVVCALGLSACAVPGEGEGGAGSSASARSALPSESSAPSGSSSASARAARPLAGRVVVLDAGHQLGNSRHPREINRLVPAGGSRKPCNTTGTATNGGFPEATFNFRVAKRLKKRLRRLGARVVMVRKGNRLDRWGPCVDVRGRAGNRIGADLKISIHADGSTARGAQGFHVIAPTSVRGWTDDIARPSRRLALAVRRGLGSVGLPRANYIAGGDGLDFRGDLATLNLSDVPVVMVELGNMRNRAEARRMTSRRGQGVYVKGLLRGVKRYLR